jgi:hypothetical protein
VDGVGHSVVAIRFVVDGVVVIAATRGSKKEVIKRTQSFTEEAYGASRKGLRPVSLSPARSAKKSSL